MSSYVRLWLYYSAMDSKYLASSSEGSWSNRVFFWLRNTFFAKYFSEVRIDIYTCLFDRFGISLTHVPFWPRNTQSLNWGPFPPHSPSSTRLSSTPSSFPHRPSSPIDAATQTVLSARGSSHNPTQNLQIELSLIAASQLLPIERIVRYACLFLAQSIGVS